MSTTYAPGNYQAEIIHHGFAEADTGTAFLYLQVRILSRCGADGKQHVCPSFQRTVKFFMSENEVCTRILLDGLHQLGVDRKDLGRLDVESPDALSLIGNRVNLRCDHKEYHGRPREEWRLARERKKLAPDRLRQIVGRLAGGEAAPDAEAVPQPSPAPPPNGTTSA